MGKRGPKPKARISTQWSSNLAYAVGLITTDGCLSKDGRHVDFTSKDVDLINLFKGCLGLNHIKTGFKASGSREKKRYMRVQFGDVVFYRWLQEIGLTPKKSLTVTSIKIPDHYFFDFLRGCFDGDGTIYAYWDPRWRSSYMFYLGFYSASRKHLKWLQGTLYRLIEIKGTIKAATRAYQLIFAKRETKILFAKMFHSIELPFLRRKFIKAKRILNIDNQHNMRGWRNPVDAYA